MAQGPTLTPDQRIPENADVNRFHGPVVGTHSHV